MEPLKITEPLKILWTTVPNAAVGSSRTTHTQSSVMCQEDVIENSP